MPSCLRRLRDALLELMGVGVIGAAAFGSLQADGPIGSSPSNCPRLQPGAIPAPNGYFVRQWEEKQTAKAALDRMVIYRHEWMYDGVKPGPYGRYHLGQILRMIHDVAVPVVIQPDLNEHLNEMRRLEVVQFLLASGVPHAEQRVIVGLPIAEGLFGIEATNVYRSILGGTMGGFGGGVGGGAGGGMGGGYGGGGIGTGFGGGIGIGGR